jgi:hypothetical protein
VFDAFNNVCSCDPPNPCDQAPFPTCDGDCPPGTICTPTTDIDGNETCRCTPLTCELSILPDCDGLCPDPGQVCRFIDTVTGCRCDPPEPPCDTSPWPTCSGDCPPGTICVPNPLGLCECLPIPCEQSPWPTCDGECPLGTVCEPQFGGGCECKPVLACDATLFPACDGGCPPGERCLNIPGSDQCRCEPIVGPRCEDTVFPTCEGACPTAERCVEGATQADPCHCEPCVTQVPDDDITLLFQDNVLLTWSGGTCATKWNVYSQRLPGLLPDLDSNGLADSYGTCFAPDLLVPQVATGAPPPVGEMDTFLVTGENPNGEGSLGFASNLLVRPNLTPCP